MGSKSFIEYFVAKVFHEDFGMIFNFFMFIDFQTTFAMLSLCYAQPPSYLICIMFPSLSILQHYVEFDYCIIIMLKKLLGVKSFGGSICHLIHRQATLPASSSRFGLLFLIWTTTPAFLDVGHWSFLHLLLISSKMITLLFWM